MKSNEMTLQGHQIENESRLMKKFLNRRLGVSDDPARFKPSLNDCIEAVLQQSDGLILDVVTGLEAKLLLDGAKKLQGQQRPINKQAVELLRTQIRSLGDTFGVQLRLAFYHSGAQSHAREALVRFEDFQLLEEKQLDASIEFAMAQQEISMGVDDMLPKLNALVSSLMGWSTVQAHLNPLRPEAFARALRESLIQHLPQLEMQVGLITPAAGLLGVSLRQLYGELTEWLRSQGVEAVTPAGSVVKAGNSEGEKDSSVQRTLLTLDKLRRLLSGELDSQLSEPKDFINTVPASMVALQDLKMVEPMMKRLSERAEKIPSTPVVGGADIALKPIEPELQGKKLGQQLGEEVVRMMLEHLMKDVRLLPEVRQQIKALEPVFLVLSQSDPRFFSERKHPARQFLDRLTQRSLRFSRPDDPDFYFFLNALQTSIANLVSTPADAAMFTSELDTLEQVFCAAEGAQRLRQEEGARALLHAEQRNLLAQELAGDFRTRLLDKNTPDRIASFLFGPWAQVVAQSQLDCSAATADPDGYLDLVDDLIWSVQAGLTRRNRSRLVHMVPVLLVKIRQGLSLIQYPDELIPLFFDELITLHEKAFEGTRMTEMSEQGAEISQAEAGDSIISLMGVDAQDADAYWLAENEAEDAGYLVEGSLMPLEPNGSVDSSARRWTALDLESGSWVELMLNGQWIRAQLTWASPHRTLFMFISGKGLAHSMSRRTMERLRNLDMMRVVSDGRVVENALDAVAQAALRNDRTQAQD